MTYFVLGVHGESIVSLVSDPCECALWIWNLGDGGCLRKMVVILCKCSDHCQCIGRDHF